MTLTVNKIKNAKPREKEYTLWEGDGFYLIVAPNGGKYFRFAYEFNGKEQQMSLGVFPHVSLKNARIARDAAKGLLAKGINPSAERKRKKLGQLAPGALSFQMVAKEFFEKHMSTWAENYSGRLTARFEKDIYPVIGAIDIKEITKQKMLEALHGIEKRGANETAHRIRNTCSQIFEYGIAAGYCDRNVAAEVRAALAPVKLGHLAAITQPAEFGKLLCAIDAYEGTRVVQAALRLHPLVYVRPGELRRAEWKHFDLDAAEWCFPLSKTRVGEQPRMHLVPLARQAVALLRELQPFTGKGRYVFPNPRTAEIPMSENAVLAALRNMGIPKEVMCGHGFRAAARTMLDERLHVRPDIIEHQLGHLVLDPLGRAYNRTTFIDERRVMMQQWADFCDSLKGVLHE